MKVVPLGRSGLHVSRYCLGTAFLGSQTPRDESERIVHRAIELGVNFVDTANTYGDKRFISSKSGFTHDFPPVEETLGQILTTRRSEVVLATKVCEPVGDGPNQRGLSRRFVMEQIELSLRRLATDYVDLYYMHHPDPTTPIEESLRAFDDIVRQGKARYVGISNFGGWQIADAVWTARHHGLAPPIVMQMNFNLLSRTVEQEQLPALEHFGLGAYAFAPLAGGVLAARYRPGEPPPKGSRGDFWEDRPGSTARPSSAPTRTTEFTSAAQRLAEWSARRGWTASQVALAWLLGEPRLTGVISGASSVTQLEQSVKAVDIALTADDRAEVAALFA